MGKWTIFKNTVIYITSLNKKKDDHDTECLRN